MANRHTFVPSYASRRWSLIWGSRRRYRVYHRVGGCLNHREGIFHSILKFFLVDNAGIFFMTSYARYFKDGVGSRRPSWRCTGCFWDRSMAKTICQAL
jgi:hypothetical protein